MQLLLFVFLALVSLQDDRNFIDPEGRFELLLPSENWKIVQYKDGANNDRTDIVYRDRAYGLLKVTRERLPDSMDLQSFVQSEIEQNLRFRPGYVYNSTERFTGAYLRGVLLEFEFSLAGKPKKARNYYLLSKDAGSVWVLRFSGNKEILGPLRHESDSIARSFKEK
ncbi:MAG: hypothetical protein RMM17_08010 [Acidobacteriota bacterium]|nr:hypothetical protein [Blastocatellia bacterium]MDW8412609.1 hypothetical protein [Acidobacteriota bacterium]